MTTRRFLFFTGASFLWLLALTPPVAADAIDGWWCSSDGRSLSIEGPRILTPGGTTLSGEYGRHDFSYTVPPREPGTGSITRMTLLSEETMELHPGTVKGKAEIWTRCSKPVS